MKKKLLLFILAAVLLFSGIAIPEKLTSNASAEYPPANYQQADGGRPWCYVYYDGYSFGSSGCGIMSTVNAVNYLTGNWMDPITVANWAHSIGGYSGAWGTERTIVYPNLEAKFGVANNFKVDWYGYGGVGDSRFINHIKNGGVAVVHGYNHYMSIVKYDNGKYLLWDNAAGPYCGYKRQTTVAGDWLTEYQLSGGLSGTYLDIDWYCLLSRRDGSGAVGSTGYSTSRDSIHVEGKKINPAKIEDNTGYTLGNYVGKSVTFYGWHASTDKVNKFGYQIDSNSIVWSDSFKVAAEQAVADAAKAQFGSGASYSRFSVSIPVTANKEQTFKVIANDGSKNVVIWTMPVHYDSSVVTSAPTTQKAATATPKPVVTATPAPGSITPFVSRDNIICENKDLYEPGGIPNGVKIDFGSHAGRTMNLFGWIASPREVGKLGYKIDNQSIVWNPGFFVEAEQGVKDVAKNLENGQGAYATRYYVEVPINDTKAHTVQVFAYLGGQEVSIWTVNVVASSSTAEPTPVPTKAPTLKPGTTATPVPKTTVRPVPVQTTVPATSGNKTQGPSNTNNPSQTNEPYPQKTEEIYVPGQNEVYDPVEETDPVYPPYNQFCKFNKDKIMTEDMLNLRKSYLDNICESASNYLRNKADVQNPSSYTQNRINFANDLFDSALDERNKNYYDDIKNSMSPEDYKRYADGMHERADQELEDFNAKMREMALEIQRKAEMTQTKENEIPMKKFEDVIKLNPEAEDYFMVDF